MVATTRRDPHLIPKGENLTVLSGTFLLGMASSESGATTTYAWGDFLLIPSEMPHFGGVGGETVVQVRGIGPFAIKLVNPATTTDREAGMALGSPPGDGYGHA